ncbi:CoA-transferase [Mesorhizobium sp.]|uniref:CoA transferase subunit A n=1 Tax=Mesorhizobium sp. TaxID=1871066 RepID=UPI0025BCE5B0|nr:CoA-transferase [Mesorhizobium sp.]
MNARSSKVVSLCEAASTIKDGCRLTLGGFAVYQKPMALVRELARQARKDLVIVGAAHSFDVDMLCAAGCLKRIETSYVGLERFGLARNFRRLAEKGGIEIVDYPELISLDRFRADQEGLEFWPVEGLGGNDVIRFNAEIKEITCPVSGRLLHAVPAAKPDVVVIHAIAADEEGNVVIPARRLFPQSADITFSRACDHVIVTAEKIVPRSFIKRHARLVEIPSYRVNAVVEVPFGSHPTPTLGRYIADDQHMAEYVEASGAEVRFTRYLERYVHSPQTHFDYLDLLGSRRLTSLQDLDSLQ